MDETGYRREKHRHNQTICIVSHGHVIQGVLSTIKSGSVDDLPRYAQLNASYSIFELINGRCAALRWGIATHVLHLDK
ncbi:histidine phosphatase family protein [Raoultella ornithinolytica]|uniref:histidine phosphatase family protein n=1 Tax=Raoultella ornithinolytica TaxID=54291 RepID=UPI00358DE279